MADAWLGLAGRVCVVTGGAGGLGRAIGAGFAAQGARVALLDIDGAEAAAAEIGGLGLECDISDEGSVAAACAAVTARLGAADVLVNNAGILRPGPLAGLSLAEWNGMLAVNLTGYLLCAQAFGAAMRERRSGSIVHIASIAASFPQGQSGAYSPGKAAVAMLSRQLALEWGPMGVRSNCVSPGMVRTPMSEAFYRAQGVAAARAELAPLKRYGVPTDIADAVLYLASPRAGYVTGQDLVVDGGIAQITMGQIPRPGFDG
jgi:NAD(P)-dependent dehydrogenase (short-subunit alcohol dehydrogenase family)